MIFKYSVKKIKDKIYITGSRLISESGNPKEDYEFSRAFGKDLIDENGKYQWTIRDNPDHNPETDLADKRYLIENNPEPFTPDEIAQQEEKKKKDQIAAEYPQDRIFEIQDQAIQALAKGEKLPKEYTDYVAFKKNVYAKR